MGSQASIPEPSDALRDGFRDAEALTSSMRPSAADEVAKEAGLKDESFGFCTPEFGWRDLLAAQRPFRLSRRCYFHVGTKPLVFVLPDLQGQLVRFQLIQLFE